MILDSVNNCEIDIRKELLQNIILTGGNSLLYGFNSKLNQKLNDIIP